MLSFTNIKHLINGRSFQDFQAGSYAKGFLSISDMVSILDIIIVNMRRPTFAAMCEDSVEWRWQRSEDGECPLVGPSPSPLYTTTTLLIRLSCVSDGRVSLQTTTTTAADPR